MVLITIYEDSLTIQRRKKQKHSTHNDIPTHDEHLTCQYSTPTPAPNSERAARVSAEQYADKLSDHSQGLWICCLALGLWICGLTVSI